VNELILKLAKESGISFGGHPMNSLNVYPSELQKFAELIIEECADLLREESERLYKLSAEEKDELFVSNFEICAEKCVDNVEALKEHFGVKE
jgi:hypothetical protein